MDAPDLRSGVDARFGTVATLVNVCGSNRSGTTMLHLMLGHGDDAFSCGEVRSRFRPRHTRHFSPVCGCGQDPCPVWARIGGGSERDFHARAARELGVDFVIDSSKDLSWTVDSQGWARRHGMRTRVVVLWKSPEERAWSHWKRRGEALGWLRGYVLYYRRLIELGLPFVTVGFRDLVEDPAGIVEALCAHLGMRHFPGKEEFRRHRSHHLFGSQGTRRQQEAGRPGIRSDPGYGAEFEPVLAEIAPVLAADPDLSRLLVELKARDFRRASAVPAAPFVRPAVMPTWYHVGRLKRAWHRRFPRRKAINY